MNTDNKKRLVKDIGNIIKEPLTDQGIYYIHDEEKMLQGYALIIGPEDSLYEFGCYLFKFDFTVNYPYEPPKLTFYCFDRDTRFHPNLYRNGKVCLSVLNTWKGESWTSCQNIKSVLLTIASILDNKPFLHEPGINEKHNDFINYHEIVRFKNFFILEEIVSQNLELHGPLYSFYNIIKQNFIKNYEKINKKLKLYEKEKYNNKELSISFYRRMRTLINYTKLKEQFQDIYCILNNNE